MKFMTWQQFLEVKNGPPKSQKAIEKARKKPGGSNVGKTRSSSGASEGPFCGPAGGAPAGSYPVTSGKQGKSAKKLAHNAPNPAGIKKCVDRVLHNK